MAASASSARARPSQRSTRTPSRRTCRRTSSPSASSLGPPTTKTRRRARSSSSRRRRMASTSTLLSSPLPPAPMAVPSRAMRASPSTPTSRSRTTTALCRAGSLPCAFTPLVRSSTNRARATSPCSASWRRRRRRATCLRLPCRRLAHLRRSMARSCGASTGRTSPCQPRSLSTASIREGCP